MGANLYWEPTQRKKHSLGEMAPSSFMDLMEEVFGSRTPKLSEKDLAVLHALGAANNARREVFAALAEAVELYGEIVLSAEY